MPPQFNFYKIIGDVWPDEGRLVWIERGFRTQFDLYGGSDISVIGDGDFWIPDQEGLLIRIIGVSLNPTAVRVQSGRFERFG